VVPWSFQRPGTRSGSIRDSRLPLKITVCYLACGFFFLAVSGWFIHPYLSGIPEYLDDAVYILLTAAILFVLVRQGVRALRATESALRESEDRLARILETNASESWCSTRRKDLVANHACRVLGSTKHGSWPWYDDPAWI
jgi:hypothetical protein